MIKNKLSLRAPTKWGMAILFCFSVVFPSIILAENKASIKYSVYNDNNDVTVHTDGLNLTFDLNDKTEFSIKGTVDVITGASRKLPIIDGVSGASPKAGTGMAENRKDYSVGVTRKEGETTLNAIFDRSVEDDYKSSSYFLTLTHEINNRNTALSVGYSDFYDEVLPFGVTWQDTKISKILDLGLTQVLTSNSQIRFNTSYGLNDGLLDNPYHRVVINNFYYKERHPIVRDTSAFAVLYNIAFPGEKLSSLQLDYRYYSDNWQIKSNTLGLRYNRYLTASLWGFLRGRYYNQNEAFFFKNVYAAEERFMTSDIKLAPFYSILYGAGLNYSLTSSLEFEMTYEQYNQYANLDYTRFYELISKDNLKSYIFYIQTGYKF